METKTQYSYLRNQRTIHGNNQWTEIKNWKNRGSDKYKKKSKNGIVIFIEQKSYEIHFKSVNGGNES